MNRLHQTIYGATFVLLVGCAGASPKPEASTTSLQSTHGVHSQPGTPTTSAGQLRPNQAPPVAAATGQIGSIFDEAVLRAREGDYPKAIRLFQSLLSQSPKLAWAAYDLGLCYDKMGDSDQAIDAYRRALTIRPDLVQAGDNLTHIYLRAGKATQGEPILRGLIARYPAGHDLNRDLATILESEGRFEEAASEAKMVLKEDERNVPAMLELASIYYHQKRFELSRMIADNARQIDGDNAAVFNMLAFLDLADKNQARALEDFKKAAELQEDLPEVQNNLGALLVTSQDYPDAIRHLQLAVHYAPAFAPAHVNLGNAYRSAKQYQLANQEYQKALRIDPSLKDSYFDLGVLYLDGSIPGTMPLDRLNQAVTYFKDFRQAGGDDAKLNQYLQDAQKAIGQERRHEEVEHRDQIRKMADTAKKAAATAKIKAMTQHVAPAGVGSGSKLGQANPSVSSTTTPPIPGDGKLDAPVSDKLGDGGK